eukprot:9489967-Pyramimonas_sp.AAC.1
MTKEGGRRERRREGKGASTALPGAMEDAAAATCEQRKHGGPTAVAHCCSGKCEGQAKSRLRRACVARASRSLRA